jgi:hypothetical protein
MALPDSFFLRDGASFQSTELTRGPWSNLHQHGGPPSALMVRAAETFGEDAAAFFVARVLVDYLKPIPIAKLDVAIEPVKLGKTAQRLLVRLLSGTDELARANILRLRRAQSTALSTRPFPLPSPQGLHLIRFGFFKNDVGYHRGIEGGYVRGRFGENTVTFWGRQTAPLVAGEEPSGLQRAVLLADAESGICNPLDIRRFSFVNPDLVVMVDREPQGEWLGLDAYSTASPLGTGIAQAALHDVYGAVGRSAQTLVIEPMLS